MKDQLDCVLNVFEELGSNQLFLNHQCSAGILFSLVLLLSSMFSILLSDQCWDCGNWLRRFFFDSPEMNCPIFFSMHMLWMTKKIQHFFDTSYSEKEYSLVQYLSNSFHSSEWFSVKSRKVLFFVVLLWPFRGLQSHLHSILTHFLHTAFVRFPSRWRPNPWTTCASHEKFWPTSENCFH